MRKVLMKHLAVLGACLLVGATAHAQPVSGRYGPLVLVVDGDRLSGVIGDMARGHGAEDAPQFMCRALVDGRLDGDGHTAGLQAWLPDDPGRIPGTLSMEGADIRVRLAENPSGCAMVSNMTVEGQRWWMKEARPDWVGVGLVTVDRAFLHSEPVDNAGREKSYLIEWDVVAVLERRAGWMHVEYIESDSSARGWIRSSDLVLSSPLNE
jgi:hypothetical protein